MSTRKKKLAERKRSRPKKRFIVDRGQCRDVFVNIAGGFFSPLMKQYLDFNGALQKVESPEVDKRLETEIRDLVRDEHIDKLAAALSRYDCSNEEFVEIVNSALQHRTTEERPSRGSREYNRRKLQETLARPLNEFCLAAIDHHLKRTQHPFCMVPKNLIPGGLPQRMARRFFSHPEEYFVDGTWINNLSNFGFKPTENCRVSIKAMFDSEDPRYKLKMVVFHKGEQTDKIPEDRATDKLDIELLFSPNGNGRMTSEITHYHTKRPYTMRRLLERFTVRDDIIDEVEYKARINDEDSSRVIYKTDTGESIRTSDGRWNFQKGNLVFGGPLLEILAEAGQDPRYEAFGYSLRRELSQTKNTRRKA